MQIQVKPLEIVKVKRRWKPKSLRAVQFQSHGKLISIISEAKYTKRDITLCLFSLYATWLICKALLLCLLHSQSIVVQKRLIVSYRSES